MAGLGFGRILIAVDSGPVAARAVDVGLGLADALNAQTALIHVAAPPVAYGAEAGIPPSELADLAQEEGRKLFAEIREGRSLPLSIQEFRQGGDPATEIVKSSRTWRADIIVIGSHGRSGVSRLVLGSVAEAVMRRAPCPVLIVRAPA